MEIINPFEEDLDKPVFSTTPVFEVRNRKTKLIASGNYFDIDGRILFVTAGHVFTNHGKNGLFVANNKSEKIYLNESKKYIFASQYAKEPGGDDDQMDIGVIPLFNVNKSTIPQNIININDIYTKPEVDINYQAVMLGFPYGLKIDEHRKIIDCPMFIYNTTFVHKPSPQFTNASSDFNYLIKYKRRDIDHLGNKKTTPKPQGISGGGLWVKNGNKDKWKIIGIPIEYHNNHSQILVTRADQLISGFRSIIADYSTNFDN
ncbi:MAG: hypothetical protein ABUK01_15535 [Leptospirales bacterium]